MNFLLVAAISFTTDGGDVSFPPADPRAVFLDSTDAVTKERARRILLGRGVESLATLLEGSHSDDPRIRELSIFTLTEMATSEVDARLDDALNDDDRAVRIAALRAIAERGRDDLEEGVALAACDPHWSVRRAAALALSRTRDDASIPHLGRLVHDADPDVAEAALRGLVRTPIEAAASVLRERFDANDVDRSSRILERLKSDDHGPAAFFLDILRSNADVRLRVMAAEALARRGVSLLDVADPDFIVLSSVSADPLVRRPVLFALARERQRAGMMFLAVLKRSSESWADSIADYVVEFLGPAARTPLLDLARATTTIPDAARAAAIHALRRFKTSSTTSELLWVYDPSLPRAMRQELIDAFEDLPQSVEARSGLISALEDPDWSLRLRAFRLLLQFSASTAQEIDLLWRYVATEPTDSARRPMSRLMAEHATGDGARRFAYQMVELLNKPEPFAQVAREALENLASPRLRAEVGRTVTKRVPGPLTHDLLRMYTRLDGPEVDHVVAEALRSAVERGDDDGVLQLLIALRGARGEQSLAAVNQIIDRVSPALRVEALRTLMKRGDPAAFEALDRLYLDLNSDERDEIVGLVPASTSTDLAPLFCSMIDREEDHVVRGSLAQRAGELKVSITPRLIALLDGDPSLAMKIQVAEALASIGGADARAALRTLFEESLARSRADNAGEDDQLFLESMARAGARGGDLGLAAPLATLLFRDARRHEHLQYDTDAAFAFEVTVMRALLDLAAASERPLDVAAAVEVEVDRAAQSGVLYLLPKAFFVGLAGALDHAPVEFDPLHAQFLELTTKLPPRGNHRDLPALIELADLATEEHDHARAAHLLEKAFLLIDFHGVEGSRYIRNALGEPAPLAGFAPLDRLRANVDLARARAHRVMGEDRLAIESYARAVAAVPFDAWLHLRVGAELREDNLDVAAARRHILTAIELAPFDADLIVRAARILAWARFADDFDDTLARLESLRTVGLAPDTVEFRLGTAESLVDLGRSAAALAELELAVALDPATKRRIERNPLLAPIWK